MKRNHAPLGTSKWKAIRLSVLARDGYVCAYCGQEANSVDHIEARANGGSMYDMDNLVAACTRCNSLKRDKSVFLVSSSTPPAFLDNNLPETRGRVLLSPFSAPLKAE